MAQTLNLGGGLINLLSTVYYTVQKFEDGMIYFFDVLKVSYAHQGSIYLIINIVKTVIL